MGVSGCLLWSRNGVGFIRHESARRAMHACVSCDTCKHTRLPLIKSTCNMILIYTPLVRPAIPSPLLKGMHMLSPPPLSPSPLSPMDGGIV